LKERSVNVSDESVPQTWGENFDEFWCEVDPLYAVIGTLLFGFGTPMAVLGDMAVLSSASRLWETDRVLLLLLIGIGLVFTVFSILGCIAVTLFWAGAGRNRGRERYVVCRQFRN
jgi:hypothetical protein